MADVQTTCLNRNRPLLTQLDFEVHYTKNDVFHQGFLQ